MHSEILLPYIFNITKRKKKSLSDIFIERVNREKREREVSQRLVRDVNIDERVFMFALDCVFFYSRSIFFGDISMLTSYHLHHKKMWLNLYSWLEH